MNATAMNDTRSTGNRTRTSAARPRRRRRLNPVQRFLKKYMAQVVIGGLILTGFLLGSFATCTVMDWRYDHMRRDYGRELVYTTYTVRSGDTMWSIASDMAALNPEFQDMRQYLSLLQKANHNYGDVLLSGTTIVIPYYQSGTGRDFVSIYERYGIVQQVEESRSQEGGADAD